MVNMNYRRFENVYNDLEDCYDHMEDQDLSEREERYSIELIDLCKLIVDKYDKN